MRILVIADTHFGHRSLAEEYQSRPPDFENKIIRNWQKMVSKDDLVVHLGDVVVGKATDWSSAIPSLPRRKVLVIGNHDKKTLSWYMANGFDFCCLDFFWEIFGLKVLFTHEPKNIGLFDLNIHGHLHLGRHREYECDERHYLFAMEKTSYQPRPLKSIVEEWKQSNKSTIVDV
ncbi:MAG: hypothetical protein HF978_06665 [Desulfobacteraceae bacterium]|nr:metallophosphoesterase [Desulfobacteraceae bacterium]MBC2755214.1 hypothetical protein [Desulfobacteraceae bacterium]